MIKYINTNITITDSSDVSTYFKCEFERLENIQIHDKYDPKTTYNLRLVSEDLVIEKRYALRNNDTDKYINAIKDIVEEYLTSKDRIAYEQLETRTQFSETKVMEDIEKRHLRFEINEISRDIQDLRKELEDGKDGTRLAKEITRGLEKLKENYSI